MTSADAARAQFDRQASEYNERWASWSEESLRRLLEFAAPEPHVRVLDIATGTGFTALAFAPHVRSVVGVDVSPGMLAQAAQRASEQGITNVEWVEADAHALPFPDSSFELVTVRIAPHHFTDPLLFLREVRRVLARDGVFVLGDTTVPDNHPDAATWQNNVERLRDGSHVANLSPKAWVALCAEAGLTVEQIDSTSGGIPINLDAWLQTSGCVGESADRVRAEFASAPDSARAAFQIVGSGEAGTTFVWQRVVLRAEVAESIVQLPFRVVTAHNQCAMQPFTTHTGIAAPLNRANVDTDQIIPKQFMKRIERTGYGPCAFFDWRYLSDGITPNPEFELNASAYQGASVLIAAKNFGCGSSREHAPWALGEYGFRALIAPSFADIFYNNCFKNGMLPVVLPEDTVLGMMQYVQANPGAEVTVDLLNCRVVGAGVDVPFEVDSFRRECLLNGWDDIALTLRHEADITAFEQRHAPFQPAMSAS